MKIIFNGESIDLDEEMTVEAFILSRNLNVDRTVASLNGTVLDKAKYGSLNLQDEDVVELFCFVGGG